MRVSWEKLRSGTATTEELAMAAAPRFCVIGSWDSFRGSWGMQRQADGSTYCFFVKLGSQGRESFLLCRDDNKEQVLHPSVPRAHADVPHSIREPSSRRLAENAWTLGAGP